MDYEKIMSEGFDYSVYYNDIMDSLSRKVNVPESVRRQLEEKRKFGLEKYGEYSFQANFQNSITSPSEKHLEEEMIDAINYVLHNLFKSKVTLMDKDILSREFEIAKKIVRLYLEILDLHEVKIDEYKDEYIGRTNETDKR